MAPARERHDTRRSGLTGDRHRLMDSEHAEARACQDRVVVGRRRGATTEAHRDLSELSKGKAEAPGSRAEGCKALRDGMAVRTKVEESSQAGRREVSHDKRRGLGRAKRGGAHELQSLMLPACTHL